MGALLRYTLHIIRILLLAVIFLGLMSIKSSSQDFQPEKSNINSKVFIATPTNTPIATPTVTPTAMPTVAPIATPDAKPIDAAANTPNNTPIKTYTNNEGSNNPEISKITKKEVEATTPEAPVKAQIKQEITINISFAGDCTIGTDVSFPYTNSFPFQLKKQNNDFNYFFRGVKPIFQNDDLTIVNLETTFTNSNTAAEKKFRFKGDPSYANILKAGSIEMVNISNNHIYDYMKQGFNDTLEALEQAGILYSGEGHIAYYNTKGVTIASIGYTGWSNSIKKNLSDDIQRAKKNADLVVVSFHWGEERMFYPNNTQLELGRFCIDQGADVVIGHHPHVIQGIEFYKNRFIVYSLGNFCFGGNRNPSDKDSFIFSGKFILGMNKSVTSKARIIPCSISSVKNVNDYQPTVLRNEEEQRVMDRIYSYSKKLKYGITPISDYIEK